MAGFSDNLAANVINHFFRASTITAPAAHYLALSGTDPTDVTADALTAELSASWYARQPVTFATPGADSVTESNLKAEFDPVTGSAVTVGYWMIFDSLTSGELLASGAFPAPKVLNVNDVFVVNPGDLVLTFD